MDRLTVNVRVERREDVSARPASQGESEENVVVAQDGGYECALLYYGSSPSRVGDFGLISYRVEHASEDFEAQVLLVA